MTDCPGNRIARPHRTWHRRIAVAALALPAVTGCANSDREAAPFDVALPDPVTVVSLESELIGHPTGLDVAPDGRLWIADVRARRVVSVASDGSDARTIGREGEGPGEFRSPTAIAAGPDRIRVVDTSNGRLEDFTPEGMHLGDHRIDAALRMGAVAVDDAGSVVAPSAGIDSSLATVHAVDESAAVVRLGPVVEAAPAMFDMVALKNQIESGSVPGFLRNAVTPAFGEDGAIWLLLQAEAEVRKYAPDGSLVFSRTLDVPEVGRAREDFFRLNRENENAASIIGLVAIVDGFEADGRLWVLMRTREAEPAVFYVLDATSGAVLGSVTVPVPATVSRFAIDGGRNRLYLAIAEDASVLAADLSAVPR
ncbi:MAG: hypothetical protein PVH00_03725 [Gemmatimonadota bacterium]|jgi:hypothetical protein